MKKTSLTPRMLIAHTAAGRVVAVLFCAALCSLAALAQAQVDYTPVIEGVKEKDVRKELEKNSYLFQFLKNKPLSREGLERRASDDVPRLRDTMIGRGHYGADIRYQVSGGAAPYTVTLTVDEGPQFKIGSYKLVWRHKSGAAAKAPDAKGFDKILKDMNGQPATPAAILDREREITDYLKENGYPMPEVFERKVLVDHATRRADVTLVLGSGTRANFGKTEVKGYDAVDGDFIRRRIGWKEGDMFNIEKVVETRKDMLKTGLFSSVDVLLDAKDGRPVVPDRKSVV